MTSNRDRKEWSLETLPNIHTNRKQLIRKKVGNKVNL
nr:MAG TPA: hypothetical protein [Caudoviricetes sp.]